MAKIKTIINGSVWLFEPREVNKSLSRANKVAVGELADEVIKDTTQYVPKDSGTLRESATIYKADRNGVIIGWSRPGLIDNEFEAADLIYEGYRPQTKTKIHNWTTPGTGAHWTEKSVRENENKWRDKFTYTWMRTFTGRR